MNSYYLICHKQKPQIYKWIHFVLNIQGQRYKSEVQVIRVKTGKPIFCIVNILAKSKENIVFLQQKFGLQIHFLLAI